MYIRFVCVYWYALTNDPLEGAPEKACQKVVFWLERPVENTTPNEKQKEMRKTTKHISWAVRTHN
jgi:hypothetical protein